MMQHMIGADEISKKINSLILSYHIKSNSFISHQDIAPGDIIWNFNMEDKDYSIHIDGTSSPLYLKFKGTCFKKHTHNECAGIIVKWIDESIFDENDIDKIRISLETQTHLDWWSLSI